MEITIKILLKCFLILVIVFSIYAFFVNRHYNNLVNKLKIGDSREYIISKLGMPNEIVPCSSEFLIWNSHLIPLNVDKQCKVYVRYKGFIKNWGLGFDKNNKLISKYTYISE